MENNKQNTKPKKLETPFLTTKKGILGKNTPVIEPKEFLLFLQKNNGHTAILEGVQPGEFYIKSSDGKQEKSILLTPDKLTTLQYNKQYFRGWIAGEDNMSPYPQEPLHNAEMYRKTTQKLAMNYRDANEAKFLEEKRKFVIYMILIAIIAIYLLYIIGKKQGWFNAPAPEPTTIIHTIVETAKTTNQITNTTGIKVV